MEEGRWEPVERQCWTAHHCEVYSLVCTPLLQPEQP